MSSEHRPRLLDLFCGAGGAAVGYARAGFEVVGVDKVAQPNYPFEFVQMDALHAIQYSSWSPRFDAIHASPPCQAFTDYRRKGHGVGDGYENLIYETRELLQATGLPYVIENVEKAAPHMNPPVVTLCGSQFDLDVKRHRLFETSWTLEPPEWPCRHGIWADDRYPGATNRKGRRTVEIGVWRIPLSIQKHAMGWGLWECKMDLHELSESLPPAYTEFIGHQLLSVVRLRDQVLAQ